MPHPHVRISILLQTLLEEGRAASLLKLHLSGQASNLLVVLGVYIGQNSVLAVGDLLRKVNGLLELEITLLERAFEVDVLDAVAKVGLGVDDSDKTELDLELYVSTLLDVFAEDSARYDVQCLATVCSVSPATPFMP